MHSMHSFTSPYSGVEINVTEYPPIMIDKKPVAVPTTRTFGAFAPVYAVPLAEGAPVPY